MRVPKSQIVVYDRTIDDKKRRLSLEAAEQALSKINDNAKEIETLCMFVIGTFLITFTIISPIKIFVVYPTVVFLTFVTINCFINYQIAKNRIFWFRSYIQFRRIWWITLDEVKDW